ncbi:hypothetical protein [Erwinia psidii]|uniref:Uncharacterized protein n=1 Tax=Erwinia psidii TaxID=69224 RepID=A0A3N6USZ2_9GAMM|nr:hypothetical protein [Erwinia psidii]RQM39139.1 hypothetical protein EB241_05120 [Erwinia psidii]
MSEWIDLGLVALIGIVMSLVTFLFLCVADRLFKNNERLGPIGCLFLSFCWPVGIFAAVAMIIYAACKFPAHEIYRRIAGDK